MKNNRISGFQWALTIFVFFIVTAVLTLVLRDYQAAIGIKRFVFDISRVAPFIAALICIIAFKNKKEQIFGLKFSIDLRVLQRIVIALIIPMSIFIIGMIAFNTMADSFILLQASDLSVSVLTIVIGHVLMAFFVEFGFRSYLQNIVESKVSTFFASIIVGLMFSIWSANTTYGMEYAGYQFLYTFSFSMIIGELIRGTRGKTIYIATIFHAAMSFAQIFLFSEELGDLFSMKVIAVSTAAIGIIYLILSYTLRLLIYLFTNRNLNESEPNNYLEKMNENEENDDETFDNSNRNEDDDHYQNTDSSNNEQNSEPDRQSRVVSDIKDEINETEDNRNTFIISDNDRHH